MGYRLDIQSLIGQKIYALRVGQISSSMHWNYAYRIYPVEMAIAEVRLGEARRESDAEFYGTGLVTWLCQNSKGGLYAFSPVGDEILGNTQVAGRNTRAFFGQDELYQEAEILRECIRKNYKNVSQVEIGLPPQEASLDERISEACGRSRAEDLPGESASLDIT